MKFKNTAGFKQVAAEFERTNYAISADLPKMADPKTLVAKMENGELTAIIKKRAESQPKQTQHSKLRQPTEPTYPVQPSRS